MKKAILLMTAFLISFILTEFVLGSVIGFPRYVLGSKKYRMHSSLGPYNTIRILPPYYTSWNTEGGFKITRRNNVGLPGIDILNDQGSRNVVLLGNSFIEGSQYQGKYIAAGYLQEKLVNMSKPLSVVNLGSSAHDPYVLWYRLLFFERYYIPHKVILVYESFERMKYYFSRWAPQLQYEDKLEFRELDTRPLVLVFRHIKNRSSYLNLLSSLVTINKGTNDNTNDGNKKSSITDQETLEYLKMSLVNYQKKYGNDFIFVSIMRDNPFESELVSFCKENGINYSANNRIMLPHNLIKGVGHLNIQGNKLLGDYLYNVLCSF